MSPALPERDALPLSELLAALQRDRRSCAVRVTDGLFEGELQLEDGALHTAKFGGLEGRAALDAMLIAEDARGEVLGEPDTSPALAPSDHGPGDLTPTDALPA